MAPEEKLKDPLVLLGLGSIFLPFVMILLFQATGVRKSTSASGRPGGIIYYSGRLDAARECLASSPEPS